MYLLAQLPVSVLDLMGPLLPGEQQTAPGIVLHRPTAQIVVSQIQLITNPGVRSGAARMQLEDCVIKTPPGKAGAVIG